MVIISAFNKAMKKAFAVIDRISIPIDISNDDEMLALIKTSIGTKFVVRWSELMCKLALQAVRTVAKSDAGLTTVDIKRYARVEKVPGGEIEQSCVLDGATATRACFCVVFCLVRSFFPFTFSTTITCRAAL